MKLSNQNKIYIFNRPLLVWLNKENQIKCSLNLKQKLTFDIYIPYIHKNLNNQTFPKNQVNKIVFDFILFIIVKFFNILSNLSTQKPNGIFINYSPKS